MNKKIWQYIFDTNAIHLSKQKERSVNKYGTCAYRIETGNKKKVLKCSVGRFITKKQYSKYVQKFHIDLTINGLLYELQHYDFNHKYINKNNFVLLNCLQAVHDMSYDINELKYNLVKIANHFNLDDSKVELIKEWNSKRQIKQNYNIEYYFTQNY